MPDQTHRLAADTRRFVADGGSTQNAWSRGLAVLLAATAVVVSGCTSTPQVAATRVDSLTWQPPIVFATRTTSVAPGSKPLGQGDTAGRAIAFTSAATPAVAATLAKQMAAAGLNVVPPGTPGALEVDIELRAWMMPAGMLGRSRADVQVAEVIDRVLAEQISPTEGPVAPGRPAELRLPLTGWKTPIGQTGMSVGLAGFLFENLGTATGARAKFNSFFGSDATGTLCISPAKACARRKGPQQDFELKGSYRLEGEIRTITATLLMVQAEPNIVQPLAYAIADWRQAALGKPAPDCQFWKTGKRTLACEPVEDMITLKELR